MSDTSSESLRNRAVRLVVEQGLTPARVASMLQCSSPAVRRWVDDYRDQQYAPASLGDGSTFVGVRLEAEPSVPPTGIALDILTPSGLTLRLQLPSVHDVAALLQSLEGESC